MLAGENGEGRGLQDHRRHCGISHLQAERADESNSFWETFSPLFFLASRLDPLPGDQPRPSMSLTRRMQPAFMRNEVSYDHQDVAQLVGELLADGNLGNLPPIRPSSHGPGPPPFFRLLLCGSGQRVPVIPELRPEGLVSQAPPPAVERSRP